MDLFEPTLPTRCVPGGDGRGAAGKSVGLLRRLARDAQGREGSWIAHITETAGRVRGSIDDDCERDTVPRDATISLVGPYMVLTLRDRGGLPYQT